MIKYLKLTLISSLSFFFLAVLIWTASFYDRIGQDTAEMDLFYQIDDTVILTEERNTSRAEQAHLTGNFKRIFYNRVPKCGSSATLSVIKELSKKLHFKHYHSTVYEIARVNATVKEEICRWLSSLPKPTLFNRHIHYINCRKFGYYNIAYINLVRDPMERALSYFSFKKYGFSSPDSQNAGDSVKYNTSFDACVAERNPDCTRYFRQIAYFCGHELSCQFPKNKTEELVSLARAKRNVVSSYLVVGIHEDIRMYFRVLEKTVPHFFASAYSTYKKIDQQASEKYASKSKDELSKVSREILNTELRIDYDFYYFIKQRFYSLVKKTLTPQEIAQG